MLLVLDVSGSSYIKAETPSSMTSAKLVGQNALLLAEHAAFQKARLAIWLAALSAHV